MTDVHVTSPRSRLSVECSIFAGIVCVTMLLMNIRLHDRYIECNRAVVMYTTDVDKARALRLSDELAGRGLFNGQPHAFQLSRPNETWEFRVIASDVTLQSPQNQQLLKTFFLPVCRAVFGDEPVRVRLTDEEFTPRVELFELP